eukprot:jgi/Mesen1/1773/ME000014S01178
MPVPRRASVGATTRIRRSEADEHAGYIVKEVSEKAGDAGLPEPTDLAHESLAWPKAKEEADSGSHQNDGGRTIAESRVEDGAGDGAAAATAASGSTSGPGDAEQEEAESAEAVPEGNAAASEGKGGGGGEQGAGGGGEAVVVSEPVRLAHREQRLRRKEKRLAELTAQDDSDDDEVAEAGERLQAQRARQIASAAGSGGGEGGGVGLGQKYSLWKRDDGPEGSDQLVRLMRDQLIMAKGYVAIAQQAGNARLVRELRIKIKDSQRALGEASQDSELPSSAAERMRSMGQLLAKARDQHYDCTSMVKKLRAMVQSAEEQGRALKKQSSFLSQLAAKTLPKGLACLSLRLTNEYFQLAPAEREFPGAHRLADNSLHHYALFSDNVLAAGVVVNSTIVNTLEPEKHVFHVVTDKLNYAAMRMWFLLSPPGKATITVQYVEEFKWLNSSYCPVLRQLESASMKEYYFKAGHAASGAASMSNLKYRNPKYLSMLNHLRFYLPEVYPGLDKILFLDDDIVVQKDLSPLWQVDMKGMVNGAVETCGASFHRYDKYLNFSNPAIARNFDPQACGWAYGMNMFDLKMWKVKDITGIYHKWQNLNEERTLWKLGTLPPGLITFYKLTYPMDKSWHVLGLGYNPNVDPDELDTAAVVHYNGNMKPWLEIAMSKFRPYWTKYVKYDHPFLQQCNISE